MLPRHSQLRLCDVPRWRLPLRYAQEETLARSSNLYSSLASAPAAPFYAQHDTAREPRYSHALLLTRAVRFVRDDASAWFPPPARTSSPPRR